MASDVTLLVVHPDTGAAVASCWIGMSLTMARAREVLQRDPDYCEQGLESWGRLSAEQASAIAEAHYADGASPDHIGQLARAYSPGEYWWILEHDF